ncbi:MAG TPA: hypothetical protein VNS09_03100 [Solirubrobacter sp.]|nr:hypothetical protein [Solirubrobacter sp.]
MTRLPELEAQLLEAARALDGTRRRWWRIALLGGGTTLALAATAVGAVRLLLPEGDPVPPAPHASVPKLDRGSTRVLSLRAEDPEGGPPWGLAITRNADGRLYCAQVGRVQAGELGVIGRDGTFNDDGRFHPLSPGANQSGTCGAWPPDGDLRMSTDEPPIPASGFTGGFLSAAGGCRENVPASTIPPQTRRKLRDVPVCQAASLRVVKYGFAGRDAVTIRYAGRTLHADPAQSGAYLFVLRPRKRPLTLTITYKDGTVCRSSYPSRVPPLPCPR